MKQTWITLVLFLVVLLAGCDQARTGEGTKPPLEMHSVSQGETVATDPRPQTLRASGFTLTQSPHTYDVKPLSPGDNLEPLCLQVTAEGCAVLLQSTDRAQRLLWQEWNKTGTALIDTGLTVKDGATVTAASWDGSNTCLLFTQPTGQTLLLPDGSTVSLADTFSDHTLAQWLLHAGNRILALSPDGQAAVFDLLGRRQWTERFSGTIRSAYVMPEGTVRLVTQWESLALLQELDLESGSLSALGVVPDALTAFPLYDGIRWGFDLLAWDGEALYGWTIGRDTLTQLLEESAANPPDTLLRSCCCLGESSLLGLTSEGLLQVTALPSVTISELPAAEIVPELSYPAGLKGLQLLDTWSVDGLNVSYLAISSPYRHLGNGVFYCYPDNDHFADGTYYHLDAAGTITEIPPDDIHTVEQEIALGQVRFRWFLLEEVLILHNLTDQELANDYTLDGQLAYASAIPNRVDAVYLRQGSGTSSLSMAVMDLSTGVATPLNIGTDANVRSIACNTSGTRYLLTLEDRSYAVSDGKTVQPLTAVTQTQGTILDAKWRDFDHESQIIYVVQGEAGTQPSLRCCDLETGTVTHLLDDYLAYNGVIEEAPRYILLSHTYALRLTAHADMQLLNLWTGEKWVLEGFDPSTGYFQPDLNGMASFTVWGERDRAAMGLLDAETATFCWFHRQPNESQQEEFDPWHLDRSTVLLPTIQTEEPGTPAFLYVYHYTFPDT